MVHKNNGSVRFSVQQVKQMQPLFFLHYEHLEFPFISSKAQHQQVGFKMTFSIKNSKWINK